MEQPKKVIIYCRVSSAKQVNDGNGLDTQEQACRAWARSHNLIVERVFYEKGVSGAQSQRPALEELFQFLDNSTDKYTVLFYDISRIARDTTLFWDINNRIVKRGHTIETTQNKIENTPIGRFLMTITAAQGQLFREENAIRAKNGMVENMKQGCWVLQPPTGYSRKRVDRRITLVRNEPTATYLQNALEGFANGRFPTQKSVLEYLKQYELKSFCGKMLTPTMTFVKNLLTNEKYTGAFAYKRWDIPYQKWAIEPIISIETYQRIQDRLNGKKTIKPRKYNTEDADFPLRRFVRCAVCGEKLTASRPKGKAGKRFAYYHCHKKGCPMCGKGIKPDIIHTEFEKILADITPAPELISVAMAAITNVYNEDNAATVAQQRKINKQLADKEKQKQAVFNTLLNAADNADVAQMCKERISDLRREITELQEKQQTAAQEQMPLDFALGIMRDFVSKPVQIWRTGDYYRKQGVLNLCFAEPIFYDREKNFRTPQMSPIFAIFDKNLGSSKEWRAQKDSNPQPSDP